MEGGRRIIRFIKRRKKTDRIFFITCIVILCLVLLVIEELGVMTLFHSINNQHQQQAIPDHLIAGLKTVPKLCPPKPHDPQRDDDGSPPPHSVHCPKAVCVPIDRQAGLGHRLTNVLQGYILSLTLDIPFAGPRLEHVGSHHGGYPGANTLFHLDKEDEIVQCPVKGDTAPTNWTLHMLNKEEFTLNTFTFWGDDEMSNAVTGSGSLNVNSLPYGNPNLDFTGAENDGCDAIEDLRKIVSNAGCNTLFVSGQFYPHTYLPAHQFLRSIYRGGEPEVVNNLLTTYLFDHTKFNIAIHIRDGGDLLTSEKRAKYFVDILGTVLGEIAPTKIPVAIFVFSEYPEQHMVPLQEVAGNSGLEQVEVMTGDKDGVELSAIEIFLHFMNADVFIGSDSSFSWMVNYIAGGSMEPVVVATGNEGEDYSKNYSPGNLIGRFDGTVRPSGQIFSSAKKWKRSKRDLLSS